MQLGFVTAILPDLTLAEIVKHANEYDYECVEVMCWPLGKAERRYAGVTHIEVENFTKTDAFNVHTLCKDANIRISGLGYYPNPLCPDRDEAKTYTDHIIKVIDAAVLLEVPCVNTFVGRDWKLSVDDNWPRFLETWKPIIHYAQEREVRVGIENCPMSFSADEWPGGKNLATTPAIWRRMFADIPSDYFGLNFDPSHFVWQQMDYLKAMREFHEKLFHVHAKDVRLEQHRLDEVGIMAFPMEYHSPKLPGLGDVDWGAFFSTLGDLRYDGPVCVEVEDRAFEDSLPARLASLKQSCRYLRQYITRIDPHDAIEDEA